MKSKKDAINPKNDDDKCLQQVAKLTLNHKEIGKNVERITKIKYFIDKYNRERINKKQYILPMFQNITQSLKKQVILLMIQNKEKWHYLVVTRLSALLTRVISSNNSHFYYLNCLPLFRKNQTQVA